MLYRKITSKIETFYKESKNALLVTGARQTGKTYSIRNYGKAYKSFVEINFIENPEAKRIFEGITGPADILLRLSALTSHPLIPGETLIFFDEIQECDDVLTAIKFLVEDGRYRYILSGSLLGVELKDIKSEPVGYMGVMEMYPLDFQEFAINAGLRSEVLDNIRNCWDTKQKVDDVVHDRMIQLFRLYLVVGGMPAAVAKYVSTNNLQTVLNTQRDIISLYRRDISKYAEKDSLKIKEIFDMIPSELDAKNKRFILKRLNEHAKYERYKDSFLWLKDVGVAIPVYNVEEVRVPLQLASQRNLFKLFSNDVGLLAAQYAEGIQLRIINGDKDINFGSVYENVVAQELTAHGVTPYYYNNKRRGELDFVISIKGEAIPIEVKSGKDYEEHRALSNVMSCKDPEIKEAIVFSNFNLSVDGKIIYAPVYMCGFIHKDISAPTHYRLDLSDL